MITANKNKTKPEVQTLVVDKHQKIRNVLSNYPEGATPKTIALFSKIPHSTVRGMIKKVPGVEAIEGIRGYYRLVHENRDNHIFSYNFHNLLLVTHIPNYNKSTVSETLSPELTNFEFILGEKSKTATMRISTPKVNGTDYPINMSSVTLAYALFKELILKHTKVNVLMSDVEVRSIEFNKDYENLKLEGVNCITIESLIEQFKVYQKKDKLRVEHKLKVPLNAEELLALLGINKYGGKKNGM